MDSAKALRPIIRHCGFRQHGVADVHCSVGFYFILGDDWKRLLAGLLGFIVARLIVLRLTRVAEQAGESAQEAGHAP